MHYSFKLMAAFAASQIIFVAADDSCTAGYSTTNVNGLTCTSECNTDHSGGDYGAVYTGTFTGCAQACTSDAQCQTAQFNQGNGYCYLKNTINPGSPSGNTDSITCQQPASNVTPTPAPIATPTPTPAPAGCSSAPSSKVFPSGRKCQVSCASDRAGGDYSAQYVGNFQACIDACGADSQCLSAQYHQDNGYCYLKNYKNTLNPSTTSDTVDCTDPPKFYIQATNVALKYGSRSQDAGLYKSNNQFATLVGYGSDQLLTFNAPDTTTADAFYIDGLGQLRSNSTSWFGVTSTGYVSSKFYITNPAPADPTYLNGYSAPVCSVGSGNVLTCLASGGANTFSICFSGRNSPAYPLGQNGVMYHTTVPHTPDQGSQCRNLQAIVTYA